MELSGPEAEGIIESGDMDGESYLIAMVKTTKEMNCAEVEVEILLSDYQEVQGFLMPFYTEQKVAGQTVIIFMMEEVKTDVEIDDSIFSKPAGN